MPKSSSLVADGLTFIAEAELKTLSLLANMWPSRNFTQVPSLEHASPHVLQQLSSAAVFAVAVSSAVAFEFPGQKLDGVASSTSEATQYSPAFAACLSNLDVLSLTWSAASSSVVVTAPLPFPSRQMNQLPLRRFVSARCRCGICIFVMKCSANTLPILFVEFIRCLRNLLQRKCSAGCRRHRTSGLRHRRGGVDSLSARLRRDLFVVLDAGRARLRALRPRFAVCECHWQLCRQQL
jgi:hypothetical protein